MAPPTSGSIEALGYIAGVLTTLAFVPQVLQTWRSRSARDLSLSMLTAFTVGIVLWLTYGIALASWPLVLSNAVTLLLTSLLLVLKLREVAAADGLGMRTPEEDATAIKTP